MKSMLVIGLGRFGLHLATKLSELGNEVLVIDKSEEKVEKITPFVTAAQIGDCQDEAVMKSLGVNNFDVCFVCVSDDFQSSLEITSMLKEFGAKFVVSKTDREKQAKFLRKIGADDVIHSEMDMAIKVATKYSANNAFDYIELSPEYAIFEIETPSDWVGKSVADVNVRQNFNVNIIAVKDKSGKIVPFLHTGKAFSADEHLIIAGSKTDGVKMMKKK